MMLGNSANAESSAGTKMLYAGEQYDSNLSQYYLRARYYDQSNGRFNRTDPYAGSPQDPQSLHKYLYCHANPVNGIDPSGMMGSFTIPGILKVVAIVAVVAFLGFLYNRTFVNRSGAINSIEVYFDPGSNNFKSDVKDRLKGIESQFGLIVPTKIFKNSNSTGLKNGYDSNTKTYRIRVNWTRSNHYIGSTERHEIDISTYKYDTSYFIDVGNDLDESNKSYLAANILMHEMVHAVYNHNSALLSKFLHHEFSGLMVDTTFCGALLESNPKADTELVPFSKRTEKRLRKAINK